jgi:hypothetical protein
MRAGFSCDPVLRRRGVLALTGGLALCGCGPRLAAPRVGDAELAAAQRSIQSAAPLTRTNRAREEEVAMLRRVSLRIAEANDALCREYGRQGCAFRIGLSTATEPNAFATDTNTVGVTVRHDRPRRQRCGAGGGGGA